MVTMSKMFSLEMPALRGETRDLQGRCGARQGTPVVWSSWQSWLSCGPPGFAVACHALRDAVTVGGENSDCEHAPASLQLFVGSDRLQLSAQLLDIAIRVLPKINAHRGKQGITRQTMASKKPNA